MAVFELPLEELRQYHGRNPRPGDFEDYWAQALVELRATDPRPELTPHELGSRAAECFHLTFTGVGAARIYAKLMRPKTVGPHPAILMFHGYGGSSGDWMDKLAYVSQGFVVAAMDCRGQGGLSEDTGGVKGTTQNGHFIRGLDDSPAKLLFRSIYLDTAQLARVIMDMSDVDAARVGVTGASQGGALTLACAALEPRIRRAAPIYPFLCDYLRVWEMDLAVGAYDELKRYFRSFDPRHERRDEVFTRLGYIDVQHLCPWIEAEVLMATGLMDTICPPSTQFAAYNKIRSAKQMLVYPDFTHESLPGASDEIFAFLSGL